MYESSNPLSALSYTNKDFQTIYPELLETVKKLTYKWDPTISNESDPGVILLKLNAIIADKNNYNIDKNILENYPETYTQMLSARSQYRQLGYRMPWYRAATTTVRFKWMDGEGDTVMKDGRYVVIPKYTTVTDSDNDKIFTTLHDLTIGNINNGDGTGSVEAIQGVLNTLTIAGNSNITLRNLDSQNRLYISDYNIAENGIFISNTGDEGKLWEQVDNVEVQGSHKLCYEFDIDARNNVCYLQFPDDIGDLIGSGLTIKYIITRGYEGNVGAKILNKYYQEPQLTLMELGVAVPNADVKASINTLLYNSTAATNGEDPETIEQAYKSYKHVVATFKTLVTLRDYMNALYQSGYVSNALVTDRTNDIQSTVRIVDRDPTAIETHQTHVMDDNRVVSYVKYEHDKHTGKQKYIFADGSMKQATEGASGDNVYVKSDVSKYLSAFDLKFYLLSRGNLLTSMDEYENTFEIDESPSTMLKLDTYLSECKSLQHDRKPIEEYTLFMLQNVYPIRLKIVPTHKLSEADINNVSTNIQVALRDLLNARNVEFGTEPQYEVIYDVIARSDERIKVVIMDDFKYTTYALYADNKGRLVFDENGNEDTERSAYSRTIKKVPVNNLMSENTVLFYSIDDSKDEKKVLSHFNKVAKAIRNNKQDPSEYLFINPYNGYMYLYDKNLPSGCNIYRYSTKINEFRLDIVAKNILAGVTPLYDAHTTFNVSLDMQQDESMSVKTDTISTSLEIAPFGFDAEFDADRRDAEYTLEENENLRFLAPSFVTDKNYSNYVKYELVMKSPTGQEEYVYADPNDADDILSRHGITNFYTRDRNGDFAKVDTCGYNVLEGITPKLKLDCYFKLPGGNNRTEDLIPLEPTSVQDAIDETFECWVPEFEPLSIYENIPQHSNDPMMVLTTPPFDWCNSYTNYYRLRQFYPDYQYVLIPEQDFTTESGEVDLNKYALYGNRHNIDGTITHNVLLNSYADGEVTHYLRLYDNTLNYFYYPQGGNSYKKIDQTTKDFTTAITDTQSWLDYVTSTRVYTLHNLVITNPSKKECYRKIDGLFTNRYWKITYPNPLRGEEDLVFYEMVYCKTGVSDTISLTESVYTEVGGSVIPDSCIHVDLNDTQFTNSMSVTNTSIQIRYVANGFTNHTLAQKVVPAFEANKYYQASSVKGSSTEYQLFTPLVHIPVDWSNNYTTYYVKNSEEAKGLDFNSPEYAQWRNGALTLYVKERTYKVPANTDYQLREGDYITFFWRESDDDTAPYQYVRYDHMYDEDNNLPTIIRPNFNITASNYANCKFDPRKQLQSSNIIPYDAAADSDFQKIYLQLVTDYDLSGTKQIDMRKINSRALDNTNHIYFITRNKEVKHGDDKFLLPMKRIKYNESDKSATYNYILQNDEYFVYTNAKMDAFEVLGAGTLLKLTRKVIDGEVTFKDIDTKLEEDPENNLGPIKVFEVDTVKISDVMFYGIDTFKDQCISVTYGSTVQDSWLLIEQQIYSFTAGDTVIIHMTDVDKSYIPCSNGDKKNYECADGSYNIYEKVGERVPIEPVYTPSETMSGEYNKCMPPFVPGIYYDGVSGQLLYDEPSDWYNWANNADKYFTITEPTWTKVEQPPEDFSTTYASYSTCISAKYPQYKTEYEPDELQDSYVRGYTVHYKSNGSVAQPLPNINVIENDYQWNVTASLNLNFDKDHAQKILPEKDSKDRVRNSRQTVKIDNEASFTSVGNNDPIYIMSDVLVDKIGGNNIDVSYVTADSEDPNKVELMVYKLNKDMSNIPWSKNNSGELKLIVEPKKDSESSNQRPYTVSGIKLELFDNDGENNHIQFGYILPVYTYNNDLRFGIKINDEWLRDMDLLSTSAFDDVYSQGCTYYKLDSELYKDVDKDEGLTLTVVIEDTTVIKQNTELIFGNLFKYKNRELFSRTDYYGINQELLEDAIRKLDVPGCFKYNHIVDDGIKIEDPLDGQSFFDINHVHNQFTIPKANIRFAKEAGAKITFVNNR